MSLRHLVLLRFHEGTGSAAVEALTEGLRGLPDRIEGIAAYRVGPDAGLVDGNWDYAISADFAAEDDFVHYRDHPVHQALIAELVRPIVAHRAAVQFAT